MIDLNTGIIDIDGIIITPNVKLSDFNAYSSGKVKVRDRRDGRGIVRLLDRVHSNGIDAGIKIEIDEDPYARRVIITPAQGISGKSMLDYSKLWMRGFAIGTYQESKDSIHGKYKWGWFSAQYSSDRDYGQVGGEIMIVYKV